MNIPILSIIVFTPIAFALILLLIPGERKGAVRMTALVGASIAVAASIGIVHWDKVGKVITAIIMSIVLSGIAGFFVIFRAGVRSY